ncbi:DgyrCDS8569 [Dimorphilus gyrociliatus]|uniref:DgyrCDS8569 n=1 Tax=Dimorphilus gyrociliatus TaxID=2664684 RepID=A0A7I8VZP0_9ANNE|nr:DgyrCDS8569 [Dimorphilus gyrociliatus]
MERSIRIFTVRPTNLPVRRISTAPATVRKPPVRIRRKLIETESSQIFLSKEQIESVQFIKPLCSLDEEVLQLCPNAAFLQADKNFRQLEPPYDPDFTQSRTSLVSSLKKPKIAVAESTATKLRIQTVKSTRQVHTPATI